MKTAERLLAMLEDTDNLLPQISMHCLAIIRLEHGSLFLFPDGSGLRYIRGWEIFHGATVFTTGEGFELTFDPPA